jgi:hypothetical protein
VKYQSHRDEDTSCQEGLLGIFKGNTTEIHFKNIALKEFDYTAFIQ